MNGLNIRQERVQRGWSIEYVADELKVDPSTIQKIETGLRKPSFELLIKILNLFGKSKLAKQIDDYFKNNER